jgi:hypothetical protein
MSQLTRHRTPEGELDLGDLITAAIGLDRTWVRRAACLAWTDDAKPTPWQVDKSQVIDGVRGSEMIKMALMVCFSCTAQYECANFAVEGMMRAGTWAMGITNLGWLQEQDDWQDIVAVAKEFNEPLHPYITDLRRSA